MTWRRLGLIFLLWCGGCAAVIVPPKVQPGDTVTVLVADYGYHSTLILPRPNAGGMVEYAYGDWTYFGQNQKSVGTALHALMASDQATLGRRLLDREPNQPGLKEAIGATSILTFSASRERVEELERALEQRFSARLDSILYSPVHQLYFVKDGEPYGMAHNCNHFTAQWLERLGCHIEGMVLTSKFRLKEPGETAPPAAPATQPAPNPANPGATGSYATGSHPWLRAPRERTVASQ